ncbi:MAG TPA: TonB-dependent receptor [Asticcacaulis sp.]|nr:TonB-dependent receptor [Asticcacaulis sp.]
MTWRSGLMATTTICGSVLAGAAAPALVVSVLTLLPTAAQAQDYTNGSLAGTVKSEAGKPEAGATVSVKGTSNAYKNTVTTSADGKFELNQIPTGRYDIEISSPDGTKAKETIVVSLGSVSSYDFTTSAASETVVVVKGRARRNIDFNRTTTGQVIDVQQTIDRVPVGRDLVSLADLVPGISVNTSFGTPVVPYASLGGASPAENIYYVDGMNVTNFRNFLGGSDVPIDFYDQIEVKTGGYSAEFGRNTGGAFIATTRSGSDTFHGGLSLSYAPDSMSSKTDVYAVDLNGTVPTYGYKKRGTHSEGTLWLSGPIWKNHVYFFALYNPRDFTDFEYQTDSTGKITQITTNTTKDAPFYGGKFTFMLNPDQRLDFTYFKDDQIPDSDQNTIGGQDTPSFQGQGGLNRIVKYTGKFTDWFSLTALYGYSGFNQTSFSDADSQAAVFENGSVIRGNPNLLIETGKDTRKNYRIDADFYYNFFGRHHTRVGGDLELLNAVDFQQYSGGVYYRYYGPATDCGSSGTITNSCVRVRTLFNGGSFNVHNRSYYVQDDWTVTDRWNLNLGLRTDTFDNRNAANVSFLKNENKISPRLGVSYDLFGDKSTKVTGFFGRFYIPIAANTNIREAGGETFLEDYYTYTSRDSTTLVPVLGTRVAHNVLSNGLVPGGDTLASHNLSAQYEDQFMLGYESHLSSGWRIGVHASYNKLFDAMEDTNLKYGKQDICAYLNIPVANCYPGGDKTQAINFGSSGYVLVNPGSDVVITLGDAFGAPYAGKVVTIPNSVLGLPTAKRTYTALEFDWERPDDGKWYLQGSLVLSKTEGNIEGGVKSDNGQTDTGLTQDFDQNGWTDGNFGLLPNHHALSLKTYGLYHINDKLTASFSAAVLSPRHYGCIGYYPFTDKRADQQTLTAWYCNSKLTPRGSQFKGDWINKLDLSFAYTDPLPIGSVRYQLDVFNVLNAQGATIMGEFGEIGGVNTPNKNYMKALDYQGPRYVRLSVRYQF